MRFMVAITLCLAPAGCDLVDGRDPFENEGRADQAQQLLEAYLDALMGGAPDRGWSLLEPTSRRMAFGNDEALYRALAEAADWSRFAYHLRLQSQDDGAYYFALDLPDGVESVPPFLLADEHRVISLYGEAHMSVVIGVMGAPSGVVAPQDP